MRIAKVDTWTKALPLVEPVAFQGQFYGDVPVAFVRIRTEDKRAGMGCAVPGLDISDDALAALTEAMSKVSEGLVERNPLERNNLVAGLEGGVRVAVEMALLDLLGQYAGMPLHVMWGSEEDGVPCSRAIPPMGTSATLTHAKSLVDGGALALRVEAFGDAEIDAQRLLRVRDAVGTDVGLALHAVGTPADLHALAAEIGPAGIDYIVLDTAEPERISRLAYGLPAPLAVRCHSVAQARSLIGAGVDLLHISLQRVGGVQALEEIAAVARGSDARLVLSSGPEPAISIAAALHFALGEPCVAFSELDGHLHIKQDPTGGCLKTELGRVSPTARHGLGWAKALA